MNVTILHNAVADSDSTADRDVLVQVAAVEEALAALGHSSRRLPCTLDLEAAQESLLDQRPDIVFNLVESLGNSDRLAHLAVRLVEDLDLPYTGARAESLHLTNNKPRAKARLRSAGLPTPDWTLCEGPGQAALKPPYIIKAIWEHASLGIDDHAVIGEGDGSTVREQIASRARQLGQACFAEQYIDGREFNLSIIASPGGTLLLPPAEIDFSAFPADKPRIVGYAAKWVPEAAEYQNTPRRFDFPESDAALLDSLRSLAGACWKLFALAGYARVDFRVDEQGRPWILEINANPCLSPDAGFAAALLRADISLATAVEWILANAVRKDLNSGLGAQEGENAGSGPTTPNAVVAMPPASSAPAKSKGRPPSVKIRSGVKPADREHVRRIVTASGLFRPAEIDVAEELVTARLEKDAASGYEFLFAEQKRSVVGYVCYGKNSLTVSSYDIYWIAVAPDKQGQGIGQALLAEAECRIAAAGGQRVYIETSQRADYRATRGFYERCGYQLASVLDDFYAPGDSRATYVKVLSPSQHADSSLDG